MQKPIILITRPHEAARRFGADLKAARLDVSICTAPVMEIVSIAGAVLSQPSALIFTSENGAFQSARFPELRGLLAYCTGPRTAAVAKQVGYDAVSADGDAEDLLAMISAQRPSGTLLHLRGESSRGEICLRLNALGIACEEQVIYRQSCVDLSQEARELLAQNIDIILPLFSPKTVSNIAQSGPFTARLHVVAMSKTVAQAAQVLNPVSTFVAAKPNGEMMLAMVKGVILSQNPRNLRVEGEGAGD